ncbi:4088_t:CDS:1, partial [Scutellospora calospora]
GKIEASTVWLWCIVEITIGEKKRKRNLSKKLCEFLKEEDHKTSRIK